MLHAFLTRNRSELIQRCRIKTAERAAQVEAPGELKHGIPIFLDQLIKTLAVEQTPHPKASRKVSGRQGGGGLSEIGATAVLHGRELSEHGFTVEQVVHDYGDLCQAITDLAFERDTTVSIDEFRTLNRCLDNAIADAVTEFAARRSALKESTAATELNERLGFLAHELRNHIHTATLAVMAIKAGHVGLTGATGAVLDRCLIGMRSLVDRSLAEVRVRAGMPSRRRLVPLADFVADIRIAASLEAQTRGCRFIVGEVAAGHALEVDREMLFAALGNLLQNAFKFTHPRSEVHLNTLIEGDRVRLQVEDRCGGLPNGAAERLFKPFEQSGEDRSGLGLGLAICKRGVEANAGILSVRDLPGIGCVFTIDLPLHGLPQTG